MKPDLTPKERGGRRGGGGGGGGATEKKGTDRESRYGKLCGGWIDIIASSVSVCTCPNRGLFRPAVVLVLP